MAHIPINFGGGSGNGSDDCTGTAAELLKGYTGILKGSDDEPVTGTLELTGNAQAAHVLSGETFYTTNPKSKVKGTMTVNSLLSFSVAAYSGRRVLAKWQNPKAAAGKPYSGVYIRYSTSGNPGKTGGTQIYKGAGSNTASEGQSQAYLDLPALSTKYYLSIYPYVTCSAGEMTGAVLNATVTTSAIMNKTFTVSTTYTIPAGYTKMDLFAVGGGASGAAGWQASTSNYGSGGGGGGYTKTVNGIAVAGGQVLTVTVGSGGAKTISSQFNVGGESNVVRNGTTLISTLGGTDDHNRYMGQGSNGGSGGGAAGEVMRSFVNGNGANGGSNGSNGVSTENNDGGTGQGTSTRAWGSSSGTLYAGGGGGGGSRFGTGGGRCPGGAGGAGGGGAGAAGYGEWETNDESGFYAPTQGAAGGKNTGGGGGGGAYRGYSGKKLSSDGGAGGSGIVLAKLY